MRKGSNNNETVSFFKETIYSCFSKHFYVVPDYQREYVWDTNKDDSPVDQLIVDIKEAFENSSAKEYFMGSIVVCKRRNKYQIVDGQQRLTTFYIFLCAFYHVFKECDVDTESIQRMLYSISVDDIKEFHLELQYKEASGFLTNLYKNDNASELCDDDLLEQRESIKRMYNAYQKIYIELKKLSEDIDKLKEFKRYFTNKIVFVQIETKIQSDALRIFETINQRGVVLNSMDLLKNMLFINVKGTEFDRLNTEWKSLIDKLNGISEKPLRFLRYYLMATYDISDRKGRIIREDDIYEWIRDNNAKCNYKEQPFEFVQGLNTGADKYIEFLNPTNELNGNSHLKNIALMGGKTYRLHLMLMLAASNMNGEALVYFKEVLESIIYYILVAGISTNRVEPLFASWSNYLRQIKTTNQLNEFVSTQVAYKFNEWKEKYDSSFKTLGLSNAPKYRVKYILARINRYLEAYTHTAADYSTNVEHYTEQEYEIEHIMPLTCDDVSQYELSDGEFKEYVNRLGNLTILEKSRNAQIKNNSFAEKSEVYKDSQIYLTKTIVTINDFGVNTATNRVNRLLKKWNKWNGESICQRQLELYELANKVWNLDSLVEA